MQKTNIWQIVIPIIILVFLAGGYFYWKDTQKQKNITEKINNNASNEVKKQKIDELSPPEIIKPEEKETIKTKTFTNSDHGISLTYPESWQETDLGGDKNVTEQLARENIAYFYRADTQTQENDPTSSLVNVKLLRFYLGKDHQINTSDDWYKYIKEKVDEYIAEPKLSSNYELKNLEVGDKIDGKWTIVEDYIENEVEKGKDYYIFNGDEIYQFVTHTPEKYYDNYFPEIETVVDSFKIK